MGGIYSSSIRLDGLGGKWWQRQIAKRLLQLAQHIIVPGMIPSLTGVPLLRISDYSNVVPLSFLGVGRAAYAPGFGWDQARLDPTTKKRDRR